MFAATGRRARRCAAASSRRRGTCSATRAPLATRSPRRRAVDRDASDAVRADADEDGSDGCRRQHGIGRLRHLRHRHCSTPAIRTRGDRTTPRWSSTAAGSRGSGPPREAPAADERRRRRRAGGASRGSSTRHAHLVFAGDRAEEFAARMTGAPYSAGGIRTTVAATRAATDEQLAANLAPAGRRDAPAGHDDGRDQERLRAHGRATRRRCLAIARQVTEETTFLGAHVVPPEYADDPAAYVDLVTGPMLDACAPHARWIDVFCERGAFDGTRPGRSSQAGRRPGCWPGCTPTSSATARACGSPASWARPPPTTAPTSPTTTSTRSPTSGTVATLLPGVEFSTRSPYPDARRLLDAGVHGRAGHRLQPGLVLHLLDAVLHRARGPRDAA